MELYQIRYFLAAADTLNFTRAAERVSVSQPALTKAIKRLEEALGGRLFDRNSKAVQLSQMGEAMLPHLREIHDSAARTRQISRALVARRQSAARIGVMCTMPFEQLLPAFASLIESQGGGAVQFREGTLEALTDQLDRGDIELAILCSPQELPRRFRARRLYDEDCVLAIGDDHRFNGRSEVEAGELHREFYCERTACEVSQHIERLLDERGVQLQTVQRAQREDWIQALVRANVGVAFMPLSMARAAGLAHVRVAGLPIVREVNLVTPADHEPLPSARGVVELLTRFDWTALQRISRPQPVALSEPVPA